MIVFGSQKTMAIWTTISSQWFQQAVQQRPRGIGLVRNTYTFPTRKVVVRGEERSRVLDYTRFCSIYKWAAVEALGVVPY